VTGAFDIYRNYNGTGGSFGDQSISATTDQDRQLGRIRSLDSKDPRRMVVVAINRTVFRRTLHCRHRQFRGLTTLRFTN